VARLIMGGSMMGVALASDEVAVGRATNCIIAATEQELRPSPAALPCIRCGNCSEACPASLMPQDLFRATEHKQFDVLENLGLFDCIECGACDVVCPSHIQLTESFQIGKRTVVQTMDHDARVRWLDAREQLRRQRVSSWEHRHSGSAADEPLSQGRRLQGVAEVIARVSREGEANA
jgi:electron transport complex protein RnfC